MNKNSYVYSKANGLLKMEAKALHYKRYIELGFFHRNEIDNYDEESIYFIAQTNDQKKVVGVTRLIRKQLDQLPTIRNFIIYDAELELLKKVETACLVEVSAFTKVPRHNVGLGLIRTIMQYSLENQIEVWICCVDQRVFRYINRLFDYPFQIIGEPKIYLGSNSMPCMFPIKDGLQHIKEKKYQMYKFLMTSDKNVKKGVLS
ncbi:hypothetical protein ACFFHM_18655 [Halalkalibacter kiskunsagensis]|uniref:N-acyl amino acid synthase FeeM catalytic core domain-containing protein n=1 Tax=Halalkalibacter kiskunsagensis TaxID=1548599 RepID=A0ABV6KGJ6_9BACI